MCKLLAAATWALAIPCVLSAQGGKTPVPERHCTIRGSISLHHDPGISHLAVNIFELSCGKVLLSGARVTVNGREIPMIRAGYYSGSGGPVPDTGGRIELAVQDGPRTVITGDIVVRNRLSGHEPADGEMVSRTKPATPLRIAWRFATSSAATNVTLFNATSGAKIHEKLFVTTGEISVPRSILPERAKVKTALTVPELDRFALRGSLTPESKLTLGNAEIFYFVTSN
jgi:hypothetical protein